MVLSESESKQQSSNTGNVDKNSAPPSGTDPIPVAGRTETSGKIEDNVAVSKSTTSNEQEEVRTEQLFKHPLQNAWSLWFFEGDRTKTWEENLNEITSFETVEDFWSLYNHIKPPSEINIGNDYSLFKQGIKPMWEDPKNQSGGGWSFTCSKSFKGDLDNLWLDVLLCLIGEAFDHSEEICGATINVRKTNSRINIWTMNCKNEEAVMEIGKKLKEVLRLRHIKINYESHSTHMYNSQSSNKTLYTI